MAKKQSRKTSARGAKKSARAGRSSPPARSRGRKAAKKAARPASRKSARTAPGKRAGGPAKKRAGAARKTTARKRTTAARGGARGKAQARRGSDGGQLSQSTIRATWIEAPEDREQRPGQTLATRSHEVIQRWADERGAKPATTPGGDPESPRMLRFDFPGFGGQNLEPVGWDEWFRTFDDRNLVFVFQDRLKNGNQSNFFRFDSPDREDG